MIMSCNAEIDDGASHQWSTLIYLHICDVMTIIVRMRVMRNLKNLARPVIKAMGQGVSFGVYLFIYLEN